MSLFTEVVKQWWPGGPTGQYDDLGNELLGPPGEAMWPAWYESGSSTEGTDAREQVVWGYTLYLPHEVADLAEALVLVGLAPADEANNAAEQRLLNPLQPNHTIVILGTEYQVLGEPSRQPGGYIVPGYIRTAIEKVSG